MSVSIDVDVRGLAEADARLARLDPLDTAELMEGLARLVQEQTRRRIHSEKTSPDGAAWPPNKTATSILVRSGALANSIDYAITGNTAVIGSGLIYARIHQLGGTITPRKAKRLRFMLGGKAVFAKKVTIPARPYLGISAANRDELLDTVTRFITARLG